MRGLPYSNFHDKAVFHAAGLSWKATVLLPSRDARLHAPERGTRNHENAQCLLSAKMLLGDQREPKSPKVFGGGTLFQKDPSPEDAFSSEVPSPGKVIFIGGRGDGSARKYVLPPDERGHLIVRP